MSALRPPPGSPLQVLAVVPCGAAGSGLSAPIPCAQELRCLFDKPAGNVPTTDQKDTIASLAQELHVDYKARNFLEHWLCRS